MSEPRFEVRRGNAVSKPISGDRLRELAAAEKIQPGDEVRRVGDEAWRPAADVLGMSVSGAHRYDVFVSHSAKDKPVADAAVHFLEERGIRCWIAPRDILPGSNWAASIIEGLGQCRVFVLVLSSHSNASQQVLQEVERAVAKGLIVIPLRIEEVEVSDALELYLGTRHWLDALTRPVEKHLNQLVEAVERILEIEPVRRVTVPGAEPRTAGGSRRPDWLSPRIAAIGGGALVLLVTVVVVLSPLRGRSAGTDGAGSGAGASAAAGVEAEPEAPTEADRQAEAERRRREEEREERHAVKRARLIEALGEGASYEADITVPGDPLFKGVITVLASDREGRDVLIEIRDAERSHARWYYSGGLALLERPVAWQGSSGARTVEGPAFRLEPAGGMNPYVLRTEDPLGAQPLTLAAPEGFDHVEGKAGGSTFTLRPSRRDPAFVPSSEAVAEILRRELAVGRTWQGGTAVDDASLDVRVVGEHGGSLYLEVVAKDDPRDFTIYEGELDAKGTAAYGWPLRMRAHSPDSEAAELWIACPDRMNVDSLAGIRSNGEPLLLRNPGPSSALPATARSLQAMTDIGRRYTGTTVPRSGPQREIALTFVGSDAARNTEALVELADRRGFLVLYHGALDTDPPGLYAWPLQPAQGRAPGTARRADAAPRRGRA